MMQETLSDVQLTLLFAMHEEAEHFLSLIEHKALAPHFPSLSQFYLATLKNQQSNTNFKVLIAVAGTSPRHQCDRIGTEAAALLCYQSLLLAKSPWIISVGTSGGINPRYQLGDIIHANQEACFFDHRIALDSFTDYGWGHYPVYCDSDLLKFDDVYAGRVVTGHSMDVRDIDAMRFEHLEADVKEMEAAAIAQLCDEFQLRFSAIKVIVNAAGDNAHHEFSANLEAISMKLAHTLYDWLVIKADRY